MQAKKKKKKQELLEERRLQWFNGLCGDMERLYMERTEWRIDRKLEERKMERRPKGHRGRAFKIRKYAESER